MALCMRKFCACAKLEGCPIAFESRVAHLPLICNDLLGIKSYLYKSSTRIYFPYSNHTTQAGKQTPLLRIFDLPLLDKN